MWEYNITILSETKEIQGLFRKKEKEREIGFDELLRSAETRADAIAHLNVEGRDNWELMAVIPTMGKTICFWKRKISEKGD